MHSATEVLRYAATRKAPGVARKAPTLVRNARSVAIGAWIVGFRSILFARKQFDGVWMDSACAQGDLVRSWREKSRDRQEPGLAGNG
jgi:hypothetical protein